MKRLLFVKNALTNNIVPVLCFILFIMVGSRLASTYVTANGVLHAPEMSFATPTLGRDLRAYAVDAWYDLRQGKPPYIFGYGSVLLTGVIIEPLEAFNLCHGAVLCGNIVFIITIVASVIGFMLLLATSIENRNTRIVAMLIYITFLLGVPMNKAIESGNPDLFLAPVFGIFLLYLRSRLQRNNRSIISSIAVGLLLGLYLNMKAFLLPFVAITLILSGKNIYVWLSFIAGFALSSFAPWLWNVKSGLFDVFFFGVRGSDFYHQYVYTEVNYGNNAIISYVSNVLQALDKTVVSLETHKILTIAGSTLLAFFIFVKPWMDEHVPFLKRSFSSYRFALLLFTVSYVVMLTIPAWSYDYRILYALPIIFVFLDEVQDRKTKQLLYLSIVFLLIKSLWIPKDRFMNVFLYLHFYYLTRTAISLWITANRHVNGRKNTSRFV